jgi:hypothetical protein
MVDILPVPDNLLIMHGGIKLFCAALGTVLFIMLLNKFRKKGTRIAAGFLAVFIFLIIGFIFSSLDNVAGWDNILGPETWLGFGIGTVLNAMANTGYFWLYIEIFRVKEKWSPLQKLGYLIFAIIEITLSILIMTHYLIGFPPDVFIVSIFYMGLTTLIYLFWIPGCIRLLKKIEDRKYRMKFYYILAMAITFFITVILMAVAGMSESPSFLTWIGSVFTIIGMYFAYHGIIQS